MDDRASSDVVAAAVEVVAMNTKTEGRSRAEVGVLIRWSGYLL